MTVMTAALMFLSACCCFTITTENKPAVDLMAKATLSQVVYTSMKEKPETYEKVWTMTIKVLEELDQTVDMTPAEISAKLTTLITSTVNKDYAIIVEAVLQNVFSKVQIGWSNKMNPEQMHMILDIFKSAINVGIERYKEAYTEAIGTMPEDMPDNPFIQ